MYFTTLRYCAWCSFYLPGHSFYKNEYAQEKEKDGLEGNFWAEHALATVDYACCKCHTAECSKGLVMAPATCLLSRLPSTSSPPLSFLFCHSQSRSVRHSRNDITRKCELQMMHITALLLLAFVSYDSKHSCLFVCREKHNGERRWRTDVSVSFSLKPDHLKRLTRWDLLRCDCTISSFWLTFNRGFPPTRIKATHERKKTRRG